MTNYNWIIPIGQPFHVSMGLTTAGEALLVDYWDAD
jgi:hypothetical protein